MDLPLADNNFNKSNFIGCKYFLRFTLHETNLFRLKYALQKTKFGWIFSGNLVLNKCDQNKSVYNFTREISNETL